MPKLRKDIAWSLYDWANSAFATSIMVGLFPVFFKQYWAKDLALEESTFWLGAISAGYAAIVAVTAPFLGAIADNRNSRKSFLFAMMLLGSVASLMLAFIGPGAWPLAGAVFALGGVGFALGNVFYDSLLTEVATPATVDKVSSQGFAMGYLGGGMLFIFHIILLSKPELIGVTEKTTVVKLAFASVGLWWFVFALPLFFKVPETKRPTEESRGSIAMLKATVKDIASRKPVWMFLVAYFLFIDGVNTISKMAVDFGINLGFGTDKLMASLVVVQLVAFPATFAGGYLAGRFGAKRCLLAAIGIYMAVVLYAFSLKAEWQFFVMAGMIGCAIGVVPALSRAVFTQMIPPGKAAEYFGLYGIFGRFAAIFGPLLLGWITVTFNNPRLGILSVGILLVAGAVVLWFVEVPKRQDFDGPL
ncbi:MAG: UMF1 family MFS transporter [Gammaproteobacteria bacterium]|jgi:UMF1 family MFS transporter